MAANTLGASLAKGLGEVGISSNIPDTANNSSPGYGDPVSE
jgi:hypothetical protein